MVADAALVDGTLVGAIGFDVAVSRVGFGEEGESEDACLPMGEGSGVGEQMVNRGPFALVFVGAWFESGSTVDEAMTACEELELGGVGVSIEIAQDEEVGVVATGSHRIDMNLELLTDAHAQFLTLCTPSFRGQMKHINIQGVTP